MTKEPVMLIKIILQIRICNNNYFIVCICNSYMFDNPDIVTISYGEMYILIHSQIFSGMNHAETPFHTIQL